MLSCWYTECITIRIAPLKLALGTLCVLTTSVCRFEFFECSLTQLVKVEDPHLRSVFLQLV